MINESEWIWEKTVVAWFKFLRWHLSGGTEVKNKKRSQVRLTYHGAVIWAHALSSRTFRTVRFQVLTMASMKLRIFWNVPLCSFLFPEDGVGLIPKSGCLLTSAYYAFRRWYEFGERRWNDILIGENRRTRKTCSSATLSLHKSHMDWSGREPGLLQWEDRVLNWMSVSN
jgi:hypothetical protein